MRGRKRVFIASTLLMALPTLTIGLLPTFASVGIAAPLLLLLMRIVLGAALCGEVPGSNAINESRWAQRRGNFLSRPKEPRSDGGWRHIEHS
jgi:MFS family permease